MAAGERKIDFLRWMIMHGVENMRRHERDTNHGVIALFKATGSDEHGIGVAIVEPAVSGIGQLPAPP